MFKVKNAFSGTFKRSCQKDAISVSLKILIDMILKGSSVNKKTAANTLDIVPKQASLTIAQLLMFNSISWARDRKEPSNTHHRREKESPHPIYAALKIHGATRDRSLIDAFYKVGICISYDRVLPISTDIANSVIARYEREAVVCPSKLHKGLFTTAAVDNIDHNPSSTIYQDSFHGTAISLVQHPTSEVKGDERNIDTFYASQCISSKKVPQLPSCYCDVPPVTVLDFMLQRYQAGLNFIQSYQNLEKKRRKTGCRTQRNCFGGKNTTIMEQCLGQHTVPCKLPRHFIGLRSLLFFLCL